ncbi:hypothetical protein HDU91_004594, partial [Kappamyces sp. JEL0680]
VTSLQLETQKIGPGDYWPPLPVLGSNADTIKYLGAEYVELMAFRDVYRTMAMDCDPSTISPFTVKAETAVVLAVLPFQDLVELASKDILYSLMFEPSVHVFAAEALQKQYLGELNWEAFRKKEIAEIKRGSD